MSQFEIFIYGGGGHGKVIIDIIKALHGAKALKGVFDDDPLKKGAEFYGSKIIGPISEYEGIIDRLLIAIGENNTRKERFENISDKVHKFVTLIHPDTIISETATIGEGTVIMPGVKINADARIGKHCIINTGAIIEHDCVVGDFSHIAPNTTLTGGVQVGSLTLVGAHSVIVPYKRVGTRCLIGAGSVITKNIPDNAIVRGNPGRIIKIKRNL
ncbi:acetyltransferase [Calditrichota bacterium LG25]